MAEDESDYVTRPGTNGIAGQLYEVKMCCLMYLRGIRHGRFHLAANLQGAGSFDDVVLKLHGDRTFLIQLKHKEISAISRKKLLSSSMKSKFGLLKYFKSYRDDIVPQFQEMSSHPIFGSSLDQVTVVLYTNANITGFPTATDHEGGILNTSTMGRSFSFIEDRDNDVWDLPQKIPAFNDHGQYKSFLQKLKVYTKQASETEIDDLIKIEICNTLHITAAHCEILFPKLLKEIQKWWSKTEGSYLTEKTPLWNEMISEVLRIVNEPVSLKIDRLKIRFNDEAVAPFVDLMRDARVLLCQTESTRLSLCKVVQVMTEGQLRFVLGQSEETLRFWQSPWCSVLVLECLDSYSELLSTLAGVLGRHPEKKVVVVTRVSDLKTSKAMRNLVLSGCVELRDDTSLASLDGTSQQRLLATNINFQGYKVPLRELIHTDHEMRDTIKVQLLLETIQRVAHVLEASKYDLEYIRGIDLESLLESMNYVGVRRHFLQCGFDMGKSINMDVLLNLQKDEIILGDNLQNIKNNLKPQRKKGKIEQLEECLEFISKHLEAQLDKLGQDEFVDSMSNLLTSIKTRRGLFGHELYVNSAIDSDILLHLKKDEELLVASLGILEVSQHELKRTLSCESLIKHFNELETILVSMRNMPEIKIDIAVYELTVHLNAIKQRRGMVHEHPDLIINSQFLSNLKEDEEKLLKNLENLKLCKPEVKDWTNLNTVLKLLDYVSKFLSVVRNKTDLRKSVNVDSFLWLMNDVGARRKLMQLKHEVQSNDFLLTFKTDQEQLGGYLQNLIRCNSQLEEVFDTLIYEISEDSTCLDNVKTFKKSQNVLNTSLRNDIILLNQTHSQMLLSEARGSLLDTIKDDISHLDVTYRVQFLRESLDSLHKTLKEDATCLGMIHCEQKVCEAFAADLVYSVLEGETLSLGVPLEKQLPYYIPRSLHREDMAQSVVQPKHRVVVIAAEPGMGKSTLMTHLAMETKIQRPSTWIVKLNLARTTYLLKSISSTGLNPEEAIQFLTKAAGVTRPFDLQIFEHSLNYTGKVAIFLDGFEEVCPTYKDHIRTILNTLESTKADKIWITTRQYMKKELENYTRSRAFSIREFSQDDQRSFLRKVWSDHVGVDEAHLTTYIDGVLRLVSESLSSAERSFMGLPLQTMLVAEVFESDLKDGFQIKKSTPRRLDITNLYEQYFRKKCEIYFEERERIDISTPGFIQASSKRQRYIESIHAIAALASYLSREELISLNDETIIENSTNFMLEYEHKWAIIGIVSSVQEAKPQFNHRTIEEFLVGKWFSEHFYNTRNFIMDSLFTSKYSVVKMIFDRILTSGCELHCALLNNDMESLNCYLNATNVNSKDKGGRTLLHIAAASKSCDDNTKVLNLLLGHGADVSCLDDVLKWSPVQYADHTSNWGSLDVMLHVKRDVPKLSTVKKHKMEVLNIACKNGYLELVRYLVRKGVDLNAQLDNHNNKPLHLATKHNQSEVVHYLLRASKKKISRVKTLLQSTVKLNAGDSDGRTALHHACINGQQNIISLLLKYGCATDVRDELNNAAINYAVNQGNLANVKLLVQAGSKLDTSDSDTIKLLFGAANEGDVSTMDVLIAAGCSLNARDECGKTLLHYATDKAKVEMVAFLAETGSELDKCDANGMTPLHYASRNENLACIIILLKMGSKPDTRDLTDSTALHYAARVGNRDIIRCLVVAGSVLDACDSHKMTPLHLACQMGHVETVRLLVKSNCKVNMCDDLNMTPLHHAAKMGHSEVVKILIGNLCNINACNLDNMSPLHFAVLGGHTDIVHLLVKERCRLDIRDEYNSTPIDCALREGNLEIVKILAEAGSKMHTNDKDALSLLFRATIEGVLGIVKSLKNSGFKLDSCDESKKTSLHLAAEKGHLHIVRFLLEAGSNVEARDECRRTPLHCASLKGHLGVVVLLIKAGCEIDACDSNNTTPLHLATENGHTSTVKFLIESGCKTEVFDRRNMTPIHHAAQNGHSDIVQLLIEFGCNVNVPDSSNMTPVLFAAEKGHFDIVKLFAQARCKLNVYGIVKMTPLHYVVRKASLTTVELLINGGCDVNACDCNNMTPLHYAAREGHVKTMMILVQAGGEVNVHDDSGMTPMHYSSREGHPNAVRFLIENGGEVDACDANKLTALHYAARGGRTEDRYTSVDTSVDYAVRGGHLEVVQLLVGAGCDLDAVDNRSETPLYCATRNGHLQIVRFLVQAGSKTENCDADMFRAAREGYIDTVKLLVMAGYNVNIRDKFRRSPLHYAARGGHTNIVEFLINQGYGVEVRDRHKLTPLHYAAEKGHFDIAKLLVQAGSSVDVFDEYHKTPLHNATMNGYFQTANFLVHSGCRVNVFDKHDRTPLHYAVKIGKLRIVKLLLENGSQVDAIDKYFMTPLHYASAEGNVDSVMELIKSGCDVNACDEYNMTPVQYAKRQGHLNVTHLLVNAGCKVDVSNSYMASLAYSDTGQRISYGSSKYEDMYQDVSYMNIDNIPSGYELRQTLRKEVEYENYELHRLKHDGSHYIYENIPSSSQRESSYENIYETIDEVLKTQRHTSGPNYENIRELR